MASPSTTIVDSPQGIRWLVEFARAGRFVLNPVHRKLARKYGVAVDGVLFSDPI